MKHHLIAASAIAAIAFSAPASAGLFGKKADPMADPAFQATLAPAEMTAPERPNGAIFQASAGYSPLVNGARAANVGDIITILLVERTQASKSNSANTDRSGSIGLNPPTTGPFSKIFSASDVGASGTQGFKGKGDAAQSNALSGEITVTVSKVYSNGTMLVRGQKQLTLNRGDEYVQVSGLVRQADVGPDNRVLSTRVADARITYSGKGEIARASRQGWLQRFFSMVSPF
ncbi:flagellar basal body L-ring protein FlgH [Sphingobium lignivorans]|uniref:Flagellar L-ring protein n=1 Tax=Sphingobium lignivorans TaxID=2735886 RepID=A0ABR6NDD2_9SPHN|nr:flagellar basal body L-ring protein FlgH [Sphingobium lignivorans]MBB5985285.1 flagellar L-ring protein precursor FlgH [Sphingobium lignivorans]